MVVSVLAIQWACADPEEPPGDPMVQPEPAFEPVLTTGDARLAERYDPTRVVARMQDVGGQCPEPADPTWTVRPMFPGATNADLQLYCVYERDAGTESPSPFSELPPGVTSTFLGQYGMDVVFDRMVLSPQADTTNMVAAYNQRFAAEAGAPDWTSAPSELDTRSRMVLIDSSPVLGPPPAASHVFNTAGDGDHGFLLAHLAREIGCFGSLEDRCLFDLHTRPALRYGTPPWPVGDATDPAEVTEGSWGTIGMLAEAVWDELRLWNAAGRSYPLVINLSIAWHPYFDGGVGDAIEVREEGATVDGRNQEPYTVRWAALDPDRWAKDVHAVWDVLAQARCQGALVVAAAGNRSGGPSGWTGPMLPAGWGAVPLSQLPPCDTDEVEDWREAPLVYAVSGLEEPGVELSVNRPESRAPLAAYGDHAVSGRGIISRDDPLTGTSVSAVVVSTTAALLWAELPELTPRRVMIRMYEGARPGKAVSGPFLDLPPEIFDADPSAADASREVRLCSVLQANGVHDWPCADDTDVVVTVPESVAGEGTTLEGAVGKTMPLAACGADQTALYDLGQVWPDTTSLCPDQQFYSPAILPWTYPQPQGTQCPFCFVDTAVGRLYLEFEVGLDFFDALTVTLTTDAEQQLHYTLPMSLMGSEPLLDLYFDPSPLPLNIATARLTMVKGPHSVTTGLLLKP